MWWVLIGLGCTEIKSELMSWMPLKVEEPPMEFDSKKQIELIPWVGELPQVTDIQFIPSESLTTALVVQKEGRLSWVVGGNAKLIAEIPVKTDSEQGLLGVAIHPDFNRNHQIYLHRTPLDGDDRTEIAEYRLSIPDLTIQKIRVLLEVPQPYPNHNGGAIHFGSDGMLYVALGDGGWRNDPDGHGQNTNTLLGAILRLNVNGEQIVPDDNPFVGVQTHHDLIWVNGLRNPWKFQPLPDGRLIIADVGQNKWEEISIAQRGANLGWNVWEGNACFTTDSCETQDAFGTPFTMPIHTYGRDLGQSITGGVFTQYNGEPIYLFSDFLSGTLWGLSDWDGTPEVQTFASLGLNVSTFGVDQTGQPYVADFVGGTIYKIMGVTE